MTSDFANDVRLVAQQVADLEESFTAARITDDPEAAFVAWQMLTEAKRALDDTLKQLGHKIGHAIGKEQTVLNGKTVKRRSSIRRTKWDNSALLRSVLDSRLVDPDTGEVTDESPLDRVQHVYPLSGGSARTTALRDRGIDPDEFSEHEFERFTLQVI